MRVAVLSFNAQRHNAVGNLIAEKVRFFLDRGAEVRVFVEDARRLHGSLSACCTEVAKVETKGAVWDFLRQADLVVAVYAQAHMLLQYLPCLTGGSTRIMLEYLGVTPPRLWTDQHREGLHTSLQQRGQVWCCDHALTISSFGRGELAEATHFSDDRITTLPPSVDTELFCPEPRERYLQQRLGIDGRLLLYVGRLAVNKRVPLLIEALALVAYDSDRVCVSASHDRNRMPRSVHVVIVGDRGDVYAEEVRRCKALALELGVANRVHFLDQLDDSDLARAYRSADVLAIPSLHEGFCVPVIEAMACGTPVVASRGTALPETVGDAGLTFTPNDAEDLARQLCRVLENRPPGRIGNPSYRIAIVSFRFGPDIVGGAETSLRTMAHALQNAGHHVEVFTTCTKSESHWKNDENAGTVTLDGLCVHRFPIDSHDPIAHGEIYRRILEANGQVSPETELAYLQHSLHSSALLNALSNRQAEFDVVITGPYLFGLTADLVQTFSAKVLLVPCFHDEALARLSVWPCLYGEAGGVLYHSAEEQHFAQSQLGVNHPNAWEVGTCLESLACASGSEEQKTYVVYCGRYAEEKNVPLLLSWAAQYQQRHPNRFDFVFMGQGNVQLPTVSWLRNLGRVDEATKRAVLHGAKALVQLSLHESLSLVALEAWAAGTPVIGHADCPVLAAQIERAQGGVAVADYELFADALDDLWQNASAWQERGASGRAYVACRYASPRQYVQCLLNAIEQMHQPIARQMRQRGIQRAQQFARQRHALRFGEFIENILTQPGRPCRHDLRLEPLLSVGRVTAGTRTLLIPVRLTNAGTHAAIADGPGQTLVCYEIHAADSPCVVIHRREVILPTLLMPGQAHVAALPITVPEAVGSYRLLLWTERKTSMNQAAVEEVILPLNVESPHEKVASGCTSAFLETVQKTLSRTHELQELPSDYVDVTEGRFAPVKRFVKRKLLNNFKQGYVDVLSRQQSQVNRDMVLMIQQLAECCAMLDHAVSGLHQRLDGIEAKVNELMNASEPEAQARDFLKGVHP